MHLRLLSFVVMLMTVLTTNLSVQAEEMPVLRFAYQDRVGSVIPIVAVAQGLFAAEGVRVESVQFDSGPANAEALYSGAVDVAGMGDTAALIMVARRPDMVILGSHASGEHRHRIMVNADSPLRNLADLRGKTLAVKKGTSTHGGLLLALKQIGLPVSDINLMDLSPSTMSEALAAGSIDAFAASEPTPSIAEAKGSRQLATFGELGNEYPILIVGPAKFAAANTEAMTRFFRALKKAEDFASAHPDAVIRLLAEQSGLSAAAVSSAMSKHRYALRLDQAIVDSLEQTADFLHAEGILETKPDLRTQLDPSFLP